MKAERRTYKDGTKKYFVIDDSDKVTRAVIIAKAENLLKHIWQSKEADTLQKTPSPHGQQKNKRRIKQNEISKNYWRINKSKQKRKK